MTQLIKDALAQLDVKNDDHWTTEGLPRLDVMKELIGEPVSRADVTSAIAGFSRKTPDVDAEKPEQTGSGESADSNVVNTDTDEADETETETEADEDASGEEVAQVELDNARKGVNVAQQRLKKAQVVMDRFITAREQKANGGSHASTVQLFQASQAKQRAEAVEKQIKLNKAISEIE